MDGKRDVWQTVKVIEEALDLLDHTCAATMSPARTLEAMMQAVRRLADRMSAEAAVWTDRAARTCATERTSGTPLSDFLAATEGRSSSEANGLVHQASRITADPAVRGAAPAGTVSPGRAAAIGAVLRQMPQAEMTPAPGWQAAQAEQRRQRALRDRGLRFADDGQGSVRFWGQLPRPRATSSVPW